MSKFESTVPPLIVTLNRRWPAKAKRRLVDLARWDAQAAQLARTALVRGPLGARRVALDTLAAHVLAPLGGLMPLEWRNEWEELQPDGGAVTR